MDDPHPTNPPVSNLPEYTVSEISGAVKRTLEDNFGRVRVRGELTEVKRYPSGHIYLSLKDENAKISGIVWKSAVSRLGMKPENGTEVIATGRITSYAERSSYQIIIERMEYAGIGALLARIEAIRQRLAAEGLFDIDRKCSLPRLPQTIGVITSERGAVIQDIRTTIARRFPRHVLLWPVPVQGDGAAERIAEAIGGFDALTGSGYPPRPDVLIVARGGGSLEDLMAFNEEIVLRAAASCRIPLISAVGHETDTTLIDYVSDCRAPTPTAAAELAVPARTELMTDLAQKNARLLGAINRHRQESRLHLSRVERLIPDLPTLLGHARQRLDDRSERALLALPALVSRRRIVLTSVERRLPEPKTLFQGRRGNLDLLSNRLIGAAHRAIGFLRSKADRTTSRLSTSPLHAGLREARAHLAGLGPRLEAASPTATLRKGYVLVTTPAGDPVISAGSVRPGTQMRLHFSDGQVDAVASAGTAGTPRVRSKPEKAQETLDL